MDMIKEKVSGYRKDLDLLKGFAILAVVLFHMHISDSGYLGVDVFFVINGFFCLKTVSVRGGSIWMETRLEDAVAEGRELNACLQGDGRRS